MYFQKRNEPSGFTMVELLVVLVIAASLFALVSMLARKARESANMVVCASNMRQIGVAMQIYADDNYGVYPDTTHTADTGQSWIYQLEEYLVKFDEVRICPADPQAELRLRNKASSYILNSLIFVPPVDAFGETIGTPRNRVNLLPDPARTILVFTASDRAGLYPGDDHTHSDLWHSWNAVLRDIAPDRHFHRSSTRSTKGSANYLYADGHIESITANELQSKITSGKNIAAIPGVDN